MPVVAGANVATGSFSPFPFGACEAISAFVSATHTTLMVFVQFAPDATTDQTSLVSAGSCCVPE